MTSPHSLSCRMLRAAGKLDMKHLPPPRHSESLVDYLVRAGVALTPETASEGLLVAAGLQALRDEVLKEI